MTPRTRLADAADAVNVARLLIAFNSEYDEAVPTEEWLAGRIRELLAGGDTDVVLLEVDEEPAGLAVLRYREALWDAAPECWLAELYVSPGRRGGGLGRILLSAAMRRAAERGATFMDLATTDHDVAAVSLYESMGFDRHERGGPEVTTYYFEIDLPAVGE